MNWKIWTGTASFWRTLPNSSLFVFLAAVFCLFGSLGFILDSRNPQRTTASELAINILVRACLAVCWAFLGTRRMFKSMILLAAVQIAAIGLLHHVYGNLPKPAVDPVALKDKLRLDAAGAMILVISGYLLFLLFFQREGKRFFAAHTEIRLATEIHQSLVPELSFKTSEFEFFGASFPSGAVGGDLVDVVVANGAWFAYVADVSGHGVPAGVLMSMTKSAARMRLALKVLDSGLLRDMNNVLKPLLTPNMFVTLAYAAWNGDPDLAFSSAGHVPLLHYRASTKNTVQCSISNLPLGILPDQEFASGTLRFECGDVLAIVSDGFTETVNSEDQEFGLAGIKVVLQNARTRELSEISTELRTHVLQYGQQRDDQTLLLLRRRA
jgi:phosphoserine phosphatase RsbU/P